MWRHVLAARYSRRSPVGFGDGIRQHAAVCRHCRGLGARHFYLLAIGAWPKAIVLAVWGAAVVSSVDNVLRPRLVADRVRLSGLAMFVAMLGGLQAFGALGIILGPVVFATAAAILDVLRETQRIARARTGHVGAEKVV